MLSFHKVFSNFLTSQTQIHKATKKFPFDNSRLQKATKNLITLSNIASKNHETFINILIMNLNPKKPVSICFWKAANTFQCSPRKGFTWRIIFFWIHWNYPFMVSQAALPFRACHDIQTELFFVAYAPCHLIRFSRFQSPNLFKEYFVRFNLVHLAKFLLSFSRKRKRSYQFNLKKDIRERWWMTWNKIKFLSVDRKFFCHFSPHSSRRKKTKDENVFKTKAKNLPSCKQIFVGILSR